MWSLSPKKGFLEFRNLVVVNLTRSKPGNKSKKKFHQHKRYFFEYYIHKLMISIKSYLADRFHYHLKKACS